MSTERKGRPVKRITWFDSSTINQGKWTYLENVHPVPICEVISIGWIVRADKDFILLAACETQEGPFGRLTAIPRGCIKRIETLCEPARRKVRQR